MLTITFGWLLQVLEVVAYIHSKHVIHYDLGCHNFLVQGNGDLALCDFGGSSIDGSEILEFPKPRYARPPLTRGEKPNFKDDIFALGTTLYEITTGQKPYKVKTDCEIALLFRSQTYPDLQELSPLGLADIIKNCWSGRYTVVEQIVHDLSKTLLILILSLLIIRSVNSPSEATTFLPLSQGAVSYHSPITLSSLFF